MHAKGGRLNGRPLSNQLKQLHTSRYTPSSALTGRLSQSQPISNLQSPISELRAPIPDFPRRKHKVLHFVTIYHSP